MPFLCSFSDFISSKCDLIITDFKQSNVMLAFIQIPNWPVVLILGLTTKHNTFKLSGLESNLNKSISNIYIYIHSKGNLNPKQIQSSQNSPSAIPILLKICIQICIPQNPFFPHSRFVFAMCLVFLYQCLARSRHRRRSTTDYRLLFRYQIMIYWSAQIKKKEWKRNRIDKAYNSTCRQ